MLKAEGSRGGPLWAPRSQPGQGWCSQWLVREEGRRKMTREATAHRQFNRERLREEQQFYQVGVKMKQGVSELTIIVNFKI